MWGRKKRPNLDSSGMPDRLASKTPQHFFAMQCKYGGTRLAEGLGIVAIVLDARSELGANVAIERQENGCQLAAIRVVGEDGGFVTVASTASERGDPLQPDDLVIWVPGKYLPDLAGYTGDTRRGWVGAIMAKIAPEMPLRNGVPWNILSDYYAPRPG